MSDWADTERAERAALLHCEPDMILPRYRVCGDCWHFNCCVMLFRCKFSALSCDWSPSRFERAKKEVGE